jgi:hypothetical protein
VHTCAPVPPEGHAHETLAPSVHDELLLQPEAITASTSEIDSDASLMRITIRQFEPRDYLVHIRQRATTSTY